MVHTFVKDEGCVSAFASSAPSRRLIGWLMGGSFGWRARYTVLAVLFVTWVVSFLDRTVMSVALPYLSTDFHLQAWQSGVLLGAFSAGYCVFQVPGGMLSDVIGMRKVAAFAMVWWSIFTAVTGAVANFTQLIVARFLFGLGEGLYPGCSFKAISVWFPKSERATANAIKFAGGSVGTALSPVIVVEIMSHWGWRPVFYVLFVPGLLVAVLFWVFVRDSPSESPRVSAKELREIDTPEGDGTAHATSAVNFRRMIADRNILLYFAILFTFDIGYWGITTWLPTYLVRARGYSMAMMGWIATLPLLASIPGTLLGGWIADRYFLKNRRAPLLFAQMISAVSLYLSNVSSTTLLLLIWQCVAGFFLSFFISAFWALPMSTVPKNVMGMVSGFINLAGQIAAFAAPVAIGFLVDGSHGGFGSTFVFLVISLLASCACLLVLPAHDTSARQPASGPERV